MNSEPELHGTDLRGTLAEIAGDARPVDLYERSLARSGQIRRRRRAGAVAAAAATVLAIGALTTQLLPTSGAAPPPPGQSLSASPSASPSPSPTSIDDEPSTPLSNATLTFPDWPGPVAELGLGTCPTGPVTFAENRYFDGEHNMFLHVGDVVSVHAGGEVHLVAQVSCAGPGEGSAGQVLAYRAEGGGFVLVGKVVDSAVVTAAEGPWGFLGGLESDGGSVTVDVAVRLSIGTELPTLEQMTQQRSYAWNGSRYAQSGGPTSFLTGSTVDLSASAGELVFAPAVGGCRAGTISLTVSNHRSAPVNDVAVALMLPGLGYRDINSAACPDLPSGQADESALVTVGSVGANSSRTVIATVVVDVDSGPFYGPGVGRFEGGLPERLYADLRVGQQRTGDRVQLSVVY